MKSFLVLLLLTSVCLAHAQPCTNPGQTPATAFPVCGTSTFQQNSVPICGSQPIIVPGCSSPTANIYSDKNPYWYKFTCFQSGTLGFLIKPNNAGDDYDWQLYDITNRNPNDVFTDASLVVTGNWAGTYGNTGASSAGVNFIQCASDPSENKNSFAAMPQLIAGHTYLLLVSHYTDSQSGYGLSFGGGTAVITDPTLPGIQSVEAGCNGNTVRIKLKKKIRCSTLTGAGSEFFITPGAIAVTSATGIGCAGGFDTDSIELQLASTLPPGSYTLNVKLGTDGNTLLDYCDNAINTTEKINFTVTPFIPTLMDSLAPLTCKPQTLRLVFKKPMLCSSVAANGSDFTVTGSYPVTVTAASANCLAGATLSKEIIVTLSQPLYTGGTFTITLNTGTDGNTIMDECSKETPVGSFIVFTIKDTVNADFSFQKRYGCVKDTVYFFHSGAHGVNQWSWTLDEGQQSSLQNPVATYQNFTTKSIRLIVSNGFCADTATGSVALTNSLKAAFDVFEDVCPKDMVKFTSQAEGIGLQHSWDFGDGGSSVNASPEYTYQQPGINTVYTVKYTVTDSIGCQKTAQKKITVYNSCYLAVPNAFTPNNDGKNDFLRVLNAVKAEKLDFRIFNRWGQLVFQTSNWKQGWDGTVKGIPQATSVYVWFLTYTDRDSKQVINRKGTATLIR
jgi:gliding motility-associated-like protein